MRFGVVLLFGLALFAQVALGQSYPDRPIRLISPNPAGGANDTIVRIIAAKMSTILGVSFVIDNRGGAGGKIGAEAVARATPDGYTLLAGSVSTHSFAPVVTPRLGYDPTRDFEPISLLALVQNVLVVSPALPVANIAELVALAKAHHGERDPVLFRADGRHDAVHRSRIGQGAGRQRRGTIGLASSRANHA